MTNHRDEEQGDDEAPITDGWRDSRALLNAGGAPALIRTRSQKRVPAELRVVISAQASIQTLGLLHLIIAIFVVTSGIRASAFPRNAFALFYISDFLCDFSESCDARFIRAASIR
jgi:hypothetical protein